LALKASLLVIIGTDLTSSKCHVILHVLNSIYIVLLRKTTQAEAAKLSMYQNLVKHSCLHTTACKLI